MDYRCPNEQQLLEEDGEKEEKGRLMDYWKEKENEKKEECDLWWVDEREKKERKK